MTLNNFDQVVLSTVRSNPLNGIMIEEYDLQGMMVFGQATNLAPFRVCTPFNIKLRV